MVILFLMDVPTSGRMQFLITTAYVAGGIGSGFVVGLFFYCVAKVFHRRTRAVPWMCVYMASCAATVSFSYSWWFLNQRLFVDPSLGVSRSLAVLINVALVGAVIVGARLLYWMLARVDEWGRRMAAYVSTLLAADVGLIVGLYAGRKNFFPGWLQVVSPTECVALVAASILLGVASYVIFLAVAGGFSRLFGSRSWRLAFLGFVAVSLATVGGFYLKPDRPGEDDRRATSLGGLKDKPNVVLVTMDTTRADHLSCYGYGKLTSPVLDKLVKEAVLFENAYATSPWTLPSHASIFTGKYPTSHGAHRSARFDRSLSGGYWQILSDRHVTMAEVLREQGYRTGAVVAGIFCSRMYGVSQGFDYYYDVWPQMSHEVRHFLVYQFARMVKNRIIALDSTIEARGWAAPPADKVNDIVFRWLARNHHEPFFLFINYFDVHSPYTPPEPYDTLFGSNELKTVYWGMPDKLYEPVYGMVRTLSQDEKEYFFSQYDGEIRYLDAQMGRLFNTLEKLGVYDDTIIIVTSDHGEGFGEHYLLYHLVSAVYDELTRIPFIVKYPKRANRKGFVAGRVSLVDIMPMVLSELGFPMPEGVQGKVGPRASGYVVAEAERGLPSPKEYGGRFNKEVTALYSGELKYIHSSDGADELYNLNLDPHELQNLMKDDPGVGREMRSQLEGVVESLREQGIEGEALEVDEGMEERLRALGYVK
jgi:arylsulfatase A-like enzyme